VNSNLAVQAQATPRLMMCPCCGGEIAIGVKACACGARFVGPPLDEKPVEIRRYGPAMTALGLLALAIALTAILTKWLAPLAVVPAWSALRAMRLAKRNPAGYGGRAVAAVTLTLAITGLVGMAAYGIGHIPRAFDNYRVRRVAATEAAMHHVAAILEEYKAKNNGYPENMAALKKLLNAEMPADYWEKTIRYRSETELVAEGNHPDAIAKISYTKFELRSAGPDGIEGTDDDIVMRDGVFFTNADLKKLPAARTSSDR
jgi:Tfp pilus assembly protein PilE